MRKGAVLQGQRRKKKDEPESNKKKYTLTTPISPEIQGVSEERWGSSVFSRTVGWCLVLLTLTVLHDDCNCAYSIALSVVPQHDFFLCFSAYISLTGKKTHIRMSQC